MIQSYQAAPHQFGPGRVHALDAGGEKTVCGQRLSECPGRMVQAKINCRTCIRSLASQQEQKVRQAEWEARERERRALQEQKDREWWDWYNLYLQSPEWLWRRDAVLKRARYVCEGCGKNRAVQVHHLTYKHVGHEMLWELVAVCKECHDWITAEDRRQREAGR
jgi:hypothetical protein